MESKHEPGKTPIKEYEIERKEKYKCRDFDYKSMPAKVEAKAQPHSRSETTYGLFAEDVLTMIALYEDDKEAYTDVIYGDYGGLAENADIVLKAWLDADNVVTLCKAFIEVQMRWDEDMAYREMLEKENDDAK